MHEIRWQPTGRPGVAARVVATVGAVALLFTARAGAQTRAYVTDFENAVVSSFLIDPATGALTPSGVPAAPTGTKPALISMHPNSRFAYVANWGAAGISAFAVHCHSGLLTPIAPPYSTGENPESMVITQGGRFLYSANFGSNSISGFAINATTGKLTALAGSPFAGGVHPISIVADGSGTRLYVANDDGAASTVRVLVANPRTGVLTAANGSPYSTSGDYAFAVAVTPSGRHVYAANGGSSDVAAFSVGRHSGILTPVAGAPFPTGPNPAFLTTDQRGRFLFVANWGGGTISTFAVNPATGVLSEVQGSPVASAPGSRFITFARDLMYVTNIESGLASVYTIATGGQLTPIAGSPFVTSGQPSSLAFACWSGHGFAAGDGAEDVDEQ